MSKITSKLQVTIPKTMAERFRLRPGDEIDWEPAGDVIRVIPPGRKRLRLDREARLRLFDRASARQRAREAAAGEAGESGARPADRGWTRESLYVRGRTP